MVNASKAYLLYNLQNETYCRLGQSKNPKAGVGVLAIKPIPAGIDPFAVTGSHSKNFQVATRSHSKTGSHFNCKDDQVVTLSPAEVNSLQPKVRKLLRDFFFPNKDGLYTVSVGGLNDMNIKYYLNHSTKPNIDLVAVDGCPFYEFRTNRRIKTGEELTFDYQGSNGLG